MSAACASGRRCWHWASALPRSDGEWQLLSRTGIAHLMAISGLHIGLAALIFFFQWAPLPARCRRGWLWCGIRWLHLQGGMTLLLLPMQCLLFHGGNPLVLAANLWAVPLVSFISTPLILAAIVTGGQRWLSAQLWRLADLSLDGVMAPLEQGWLTLPGQGLVLSAVGWLGITSGVSAGGAVIP